MAEPKSLLARIPQHSVAIVAVVWFAFDFATKAGYVRPAPVPIESHATSSELERYARMNNEAIQANARMVADLHAGIAPRDANMTPQWTAMRQSMDRLSGEIVDLRRAVQGATSATRGLTYELEDSGHRAPQAGADARPPQPTQPTAGWFRRLGHWFTGGSAG